MLWNTFKVTTRPYMHFGPVEHLALYTKQRTINLLVTPFLAEIKTWSYDLADFLFHNISIVKH